MARRRKAIVLSGEHKTFRSEYSAPEAMASMWRDYNRRFQTMGFVLSPQDLLADKSCESKGSSQPVYLNRKLISQESIGRSKGKNVTLVIPKKATITPPVVNFRKENITEIKREGEAKDVSR